MPEITLWSQRLNKSIQLTRHARARMLERNLTEARRVYKQSVIPLCNIDVFGA